MKYQLILFSITHHQVILFYKFKTVILLQLVGEIHNIQLYYIMIGDVDYTSGPYIVTFPAGMITASFNIPILDDNVLENDEQFQLSIIFNSLPDRVTISDPSQTTVTIRDDDGN